MISTIEIMRERDDNKESAYRAIYGEQHAAGATAGQALDALEQMLVTSRKATSGSTVVIVQRFQADDSFSALQQERLQELMERFHQAVNTDTKLSTAEREELEQLVAAEWRAAITRTGEILDQLNRDKS